MKKTAIGAVFALGAILAFHQPASAAATMQSSGSWNYTAGASGQTYNFAPITGVDWLGGAQAATSVGAPGAAGGGSDPVPEPSTLALLGFPLLFVAALVRRRR